MMRWRKAGAAALAVAATFGAPALPGTVTGASSELAAQRFEISFPESARAEGVTGRVYVMIARDGSREPRFQVGRTGIPLFGRDVDGLAPGETAVIDATDLGSPPHPWLPGPEIGNVTVCRIS